MNDRIRKSYEYLIKKMGRELAHDKIKKSALWYMKKHNRPFDKAVGWAITKWECLIGKGMYHIEPQGKMTDGGKGSGNFGHKGYIEE